MIGIDNNSNLFRWEFWHSKSNSQYMDGMLSLADSGKFSQNKSQLNAEIPNYLGYSVSRSSYNEKKLFLARLACDGAVDYCMISNSEKDFPDYEPNEIYHYIGETINFSDFSGKYIIIKLLINFRSLCARVGNEANSIQRPSGIFCTGLAIVFSS